MKRNQRCLGTKANLLNGELRAKHVAWKNLGRYIDSIERDGEVLRISRPVDVELEAGAIADLLVKTGGPAVIFENPRLPDGSKSDIPLAMNLFGSHSRTMKALGANGTNEIGDRLVSLMKPDIGGYMKAPWRGLPLLRDALALPPKMVWSAASQQIVDLEPDVTRLPIPKCWPLDGGRYITLPLVVTKDPITEEHNLGMYRGQVHSGREIGLHWQIHKHGADHAASHAGSKMPVAICIGGPPELIFSAISPLPDNLEEYMFAGFLGKRRLGLTRAKTQDLLVPAEADIIIEGWTDPSEKRREGPFGDHYGFYSLPGDYPVMHVTAITRRRNAILPATIVGQPPMEDGYLGEAIGAQFTPVLRFQHRDVRSVYLPLETGFHNLAIISSRQRYPRQARKTAMGLFGAGQMMLLKSIMLIDENEDPHDLEVFLDALNDRVDPSEDILKIEGLPGDSLDPANPYENVQSKILVDATTLPKTDPRHGGKIPLGTQEIETPDWRRGKSEPPGVSPEFVDLVKGSNAIKQAMLLRNSMLVVTIDVDGGPTPREGMMDPDEIKASLQRESIDETIHTIWGLEGSENLRWLFITDDDLRLDSPGAKRRLLWQLFARFDVDRGLKWDASRNRVAWDATAPIPSKESEIPARHWPAVTLHDPNILKRIKEHAEEDGLGGRDWPENLLM